MLLDKLRAMSQTKLILFCTLVFACAFGLLLWWQVHPDPVPAPRTERPIDVSDVRARAESGEAAAQAQLGGLYAKGIVLTNDYAEAAKWFAKAAAQGHPEGQLGLGELHEAGRGVARDLAEAIRLYRLAAEQGCSRAEYTLAFMYEAGRGLKADPKEATRWFQRAAEHGDALAQYDLGQRYDLGVGTAVDKIEALKWLSLAAAQGQVDAAARLKLVKQTMTREQVAEAQRRASAFSQGTVSK